MAIRAYSVAKDGSKQLSANFKIREFRCKDGSDLVYIDDDLVTLVQNIRTHFGRATTINSAYRTESHNEAVGGSKNSQHLYGRAADIVVDGVAPSKVADYAETLMPKTGGIGRYSGFTHVDTRPNKSRWNG